MIRPLICTIALTAMAVLVAGCASCGIGLPDEHLPFPVPDGTYALSRHNGNGVVRIEVRHQDGMVKFGFMDLAATAHQRGGASVMQLAMDDMPRGKTYAYVQVIPRGSEFLIRVFDSKAPAAQARITEVMGGNPWYTDPAQKKTDRLDVQGPRLIHVRDQASLERFSSLLGDPALFVDLDALETSQDMPPVAVTHSVLRAWTAEDQKEADAPEVIGPYELAKSLDGALTFGTDSFFAGDVHTLYVAIGADRVEESSPCTVTTSTALDHPPHPGGRWNLKPQGMLIILMSADTPRIKARAQGSILDRSLQPTEETWLIKGVRHTVLLYGQNPGLLAKCREKFLQRK